MESNFVGNIKNTILYQRLKSVSWEYYFNKIKDRWLYIIGAIMVLFLPWMTAWPFIGKIIKSAQEIEAFPNEAFLIIILTQSVILSIYASSWDLLAGYSGQISFGHSLFLGFSSYLSTFYVTGFVIKKIVFFSSKESAIRNFGPIAIDMTVLSGIIVGSIITAIFAIIIAIFTLRLRGAYFALVTLVLPLIFQLLVKDIWEDYTGGNQGIPGVPRLVIEGDNFVENLKNYYIVSLWFFVISIFIISALAKSRFGTVLRSIREDEIASAASGINVSFYKVVVFGISAFFAGIAGALITQTVRSSTPGIFGLARSFEVIIYTILGGIGSITGAVVGTFFLVFVINSYLADGFIDIPTLETLSLGIILLISLRFQPLGLIRSSKKFRNGFLFGLFFSFLITFYDFGKIFNFLSSVFSPSTMLINNFGENGFLGYVNVNVTEGRMIIYFIVGMIIGYFGPDTFSYLRLKFWGVWPSIGNYEPPK